MANKRVYRVFANRVETLVKANSKKEVINYYGVKTVDFWCNITKKTNLYSKTLKRYDI